MKCEACGKSYKREQSMKKHKCKAPPGEYILGRKLVAPSGDQPCTVDGCSFCKHSDTWHSFSTVRNRMLCVIILQCSRCFVANRTYMYSVIVNFPYKVLFVYLVSIIQTLLVLPFTQFFILLICLLLLLNHYHYSCEKFQYSYNSSLLL